MWESTLFLDAQAAVPVGFCPVCGSECYGPEPVCLRCERRDGHDHAAAQ